MSGPSTETCGVPQTLGHSIGAAPLIITELLSRMGVMHLRWGDRAGAHSTGDTLGESHGAGNETTRGRLATGEAANAIVNGVKYRFSVVHPSAPHTADLCHFRGALLMDRAPHNSWSETSLLRLCRSTL
uniref:Uncharacterized protein n=1 Tax=Knipowitschia caucasica TaxID=637954 RepID=A0AAV2L325_KNICA